MSGLDSALILLTVAAGTLISWYQYRSIRLRMKPIARALGLELDSSFITGTRMHGRRDGFAIRISRARERYSCVVGGEGRIPASIALEAETVFSRLTRDIHIGDDDFDYRTNITGRTDVALALLGHQTREMVLSEVVTGGAKVRGGRIYRDGNAPDSLAAAVPGLLNLARQLEMRDDEVPERLAANATGDPDPVVRLMNMRCLNERYRHSEPANQARHQALNDPIPELRLDAAVHLGETGLEVLEDIALSDEVDQELRIRAIQALSRCVWAERVLPLLETLLEPNQPGRVQRAAIGGLGRIGLPDARDRSELERREGLEAYLRSDVHRPSATAMQRLLDMAADADTPTAETLAIAFGRIGDSAAEPALLQLLDHTEERIRIAAAHNLGMIGTARAVEPLLELGKGVIPNRFKIVARRAVERIQLRLEGAEVGQLSISEITDPHGALSTTEDIESRGEVSLVDNT